MALVKELVEFMDGHIDVKSELGVGTEVIFSLPIYNKEEPIIQTIKILAGATIEKNEFQVEPNTVTIPGGKSIVLTIEDNKDVQYYLNTCLQDNYQVINAMDGNEGIAKALEFVPDIISPVLCTVQKYYEIKNPKLVILKFK